MTDVATGVGHAGARAVGTALAVAVATYLLVLSSLHLRAFGQPLVVVRAAVASAVVLGIGALGPAPGPTVLLMGVTVAATVAVHVVADRPPTGRSGPGPRPAHLGELSATDPRGPRGSAVSSPARPRRLPRPDRTAQTSGVSSRTWVARARTRWSAAT